MRPLAVLVLVIAAVAALLFSLSTLLGGPQEPTGGGADLPAVASDDEIERADRPPTPLISDGQRDVVNPVPVPIEGPGESNASGPPAPVGEFTLRGRVLDPQGSPLAGIPLKLTRRDLPAQLMVFQMGDALQPAAPEPGMVHKTSAEDGSFSFERLEAGSNYRIIADDPDGRYAQHYSEKITVGSRDVTEYDVRFVFGLICEGFVRDVGGAAIPDAKLELVNQMEAFLRVGNATPEASDRLETRTQEDGYYRFSNVSPGMRNLIVSAPGFGTQTAINLSFNLHKEVTERNFTLDYGLCITGVVIGPDGTGVAGVEIEAISYQTAMMSRGSTVSLEDGSFELCDLADAQYILVARKAGYVENRDQTRIEAGTQNVSIELSQLGGVTGTVVDCSNNQPVERFRVNARMVHPNTPGYGRAVASQLVESETGEFTLTGLPDGTYVVQAFAQGFAPTFSDTFTVAEGFTTPDVRICATRGGTLTGRVVSRETGEPVAGAVVQTYDNGHIDNPITTIFSGAIPRMTADVSARTDADGRFELTFLNQEVYQLQISHPRFTKRFLHDQRVLEGAENDLGDLRLSRGAIVTGTVYDAAGNPLAGARVQLTGGSQTGHTGSSMQTFEGHSDSAGRFRIERIAEGSYRMTATSGNASASGDPFGQIIEMKNSEVPITVSDGDTVQQDLNLGGA